MFECHWPLLPLGSRGPQDAVETVQATSGTVEAPAPVLAPLAVPQSAIRRCPTCGVELADGRRRYCSDECKAKRNGHDPKPLPDLTERPMRGQDYEKDWLADQLAPPKLPWET